MKIPQISLVAAVGAGGVIGPADALPEMMFETDAIFWQEWVCDLTKGGVLVFGSKTLRLMAERQVAFDPQSIIVEWTRDVGCSNPEEFLTQIAQMGRPIFICGGKATFESFMPYVTMFFIRRTAMQVPHDNYMPPMFGRTQ